MAMKFRESSSGYIRFDFAFLFPNDTEIGYYYKSKIGRIYWQPELCSRPPFVDYKGCHEFLDKKRWCR